jgi:putative ABC transport system substrate-binding protein
MKRRQFLIGASVAAAARPAIGRAQQTKFPVIGILGLNTPADAEIARNIAAFRAALAETGYVEGRNVKIEYRWAHGDYDRLPSLAAELVALPVDVLVNEGSDPTVYAARDATSTIPIVFHTSDDPVAGRLVASLARPGGNLTGIHLLNVGLAPKLLELLAELVPNAKVIALLVNRHNSRTPNITQEVTGAAASAGLQLQMLEGGTEAEIDMAFSTLEKRPADALLVGADALFTTRREQIISLAARHSIPAIYSQTLFVKAGGLIAYGPSVSAAYHVKGIYTGRILSGAKPADLPVQRPTTFELAINTRTAKALGVLVPPTLLARADEVIE